MASHDAYTLGWICALPLEMTAAIAMLDTTNPQLSYPPTDQNAYTLGSIAGHDVVITCLPSGIYGTVSAATVLSQMLFTFPQIQFGVMVGIGGGVPGERYDIRLGDVVVSKPTGSCSGVVQYDYGKAMQGGRFEQTGSLNHPPQLLLTHMSLLQAKMMDQKEGLITPLMQKVLSQHPQLKGKFGCPGPDKDVLFRAIYPHDVGMGSNDTCADCDRHEAVPRKSRPSMEPYVHYGIIASGDQVMKDSEARDRLAQELGIICFEMEAAGLMNQLQCLVIRGICDYSDSHKNKQWQGYAALTAATYTKLLLSTLRPRTLKYINKSANGEMTAEEKACLRDLFLSDPEEDKNALKRRKGERAPDTCSWILGTNELQNWLGVHGGNHRPSLGFVKGDADLSSNLLWLYGNPGTGKSTMAITMAEELPRKPYFDSTKSLAYFFCDSSSENRRTAVSILRGLLYQLIKGRVELVELLFSKYQERKGALFNSFDALWSVLLSIGADAASGDKYCIIDALDECEPESQAMLLAQINQTFLDPNRETNLHLHILITSRPYPEIGRYLTQFKNQDLSQYDQVAADLNLLIKSKVGDLSKKNRYSEKIAAKVSMILADKAEGTFLWVGIACTELASVRSRDAIKTLQKLPRGLDSLYRNLLDTALTHDGDDKQTILQMMSVVAISQQPLTVTELSVACNLYPDEDEESRLNFTQEDIELCRLIIVVQNGIVRLLHKSVRDFLLRKGEESSHLIDDLTAHATLAYRCLDTWLENYQHLPTSGKQLSDIEFLQYAARFWGIHAHHAESEFRVLKQHERFFRAKSSERNAWVKMLEFQLGLPNNPERFSALHLSALFGIVGLVDFAFDEMQQGLVFGKWRKAHPRFEDIKFTDGFIPTPLQIAAENGQVEVMALLLEKKVDRMEILAQVIEAAALNEERGGQMVALLLTHVDGEVQLDESVFKAAARNRSHGGAIMSMLLDRDPDVLISQELQKSAAAKPTLGGLAITRLSELYSNRSPRIGRPKITQVVIDYAVSNQRDGTAVMAILLGRLGDKLQLSDRIVEDMCSHLDPSVVQLLVDQKKSQMPLTGGLADAALRNPSHADEIILALLDQCDALCISSQLILEKICGQLSPGAINRFLDRQKEPLNLTPYAASAVGHRGIMKEEVIRILLDRCRKPDWLDVAKQICTSFSPGIVHDLLNKYETFEITEPIISAIARYSANASGVMKTILFQSQKTKLEKGAILLICQKFDVDVVRLLLSQEDDITITSDIVTSVDMNWDKKEVMITLVEHCGEIDMAPNVIAMICELFDSEVVELLSTKQNGLEVTPELMHATLDNKDHAREVMRVIIRQAAHGSVDHYSVAMLCRILDAETVDKLRGVIITKAVVHAAAENLLYGRDIITLLLRKHGRHLDWKVTAAVHELFAGDFKILELVQGHTGALPWIQNSEGLRVVLEGTQDLAAAYVHCDAESIVMMLDDYGDTQDTEDAIRLAAGNMIDAKNVMLVLLDRFQGQIQLTEAVFEAAAANEYHGRDVMEVLLDREGNSFLISEAVVRAAVSNYRNGKDLVQLLLSRCQHRLLTDGVLKAALTNHQGGREIITLLLESYPDSTVHVTSDLVRIAAATNGSNMLALLLRDQRIQLIIQQEAVGTMCQLFNSELVSLLLVYHGDRLTITDDIVKAAATNCLHGKEVLGLLLETQQPTPQTMEKALEVAAAADEKEMVDFLLEQRGKEDRISEDIVCAAAGNKWGTCEVLSYLIDRFKSRVPITERMLVAAAGNGRDALFLLLRQREDRIPITDAILQAASTNQYHGKRVLDQLQRYRNDVPL
ncbi:hypothetical protein BDW59DRAFT_46333 [Aspergillus cavernicola]|uniref:Ankyrin repeat-containing domain protein n=1 Tax=Aspergillus cavernicola TaxID=176166 RepID=A0ABR4J2Q5_9EURO